MLKKSKRNIEKNFKIIIRNTSLLIFLKVSILSEINVKNVKISFGILIQKEKFVVIQIVLENMILLVDQIILILIKNFL